MLQVSELKRLSYERSAVGLERLAGDGERLILIQHASMVGGQGGGW